MFKQQIKLICACFIVIGEREIDATLVRQTHTLREQKTHLYPKRSEKFGTKANSRCSFSILRTRRGEKKRIRAKSTAAYTNITKQEKVPCPRHRRREKILLRVGVGTATKYSRSRAMCAARGERATKYTAALDENGIFACLIILDGNRSRFSPQKSVWILNLILAFMGEYNQKSGIDSTIVAQKKQNGNKIHSFSPSAVYSCVRWKAAAEKSFSLLRVFNKRQSVKSLEREQAERDFSHCA